MVAPVEYQSWYKYPRVDAIGTPDIYGNFPKPDSNIQLSAGHPVTALLAGTVTDVDRTSAWGCAVTIKLDKPLNQLATHTAYLHLAGQIPVGVGDHVNAGDLIGYSGSSLACGSQKVPLGFALYAGDAYGYGDAWQKQMQYVTTLLNPVPLLDAAKGGKLGDIGGYYANLNGSGNGSSFSLTDPSTWLSAIVGQNTTNWVGNPMRVIKMLVGIVCIGIALFLLAAPAENAITQAVAPIVKSAAVFGA